MNQPDSLSARLAGTRPLAVASEKRGAGDRRLSQDIQRLLDDWEFEPDQLQVRVIISDDGKEKIQMRIDLGMVQMEISGRPDGKRPQGHESLLEFYEARAKHATDTGTPFSLSSDDCAQLMREGLQYYHRYLSAFHLERYDLVARDTERNLRLFSFVAPACRTAARQARVRPVPALRPNDAHPRLGFAGRSRTEITGAALALIDDGIKPSAGSSATTNRKSARPNVPSFAFWFAGAAKSNASDPIDLLEKLEQQLELSVVLERLRRSRPAPRPDPPAAGIQLEIVATTARPCSVIHTTAPGFRRSRLLAS